VIAKHVEGSRKKTMLTLTSEQMSGEMSVIDPRNRKQLLMRHS